MRLLPAGTDDVGEGGTVWGLGATFKSNISFKDGPTVETNFNNFGIAQMYETPPIEVQGNFLRSHCWTMIVAEVIQSAPEKTSQ